MSDELLKWRSEFPILERSVYLISHSLGAMPKATYERLQEYADIWATRGVRAWAEGWWDMPVTVGNEVARIIGADPGTVVNPLLAEGQVRGAVAQGLGQCLVEEAVYDEEGQPRTASFADYKLLTAAEVPDFPSEFVSTPSPLNPLGAKGVGEAGAIGTPAALANAVADALAAEGLPGLDPPFTEERLWRALNAREG